MGGGGKGEESFWELTLALSSILEDVDGSYPILIAKNAVRMGHPRFPG
jgi:hypothetical protein